MKIRISILLFLSSLSLFLASCKNNRPYKPDYKMISGYVIGKETCNRNESKDYWLIDFTYDNEQPQIGDTLMLSGITYTNVLKVKGLDEDLKHIGMAVEIDYKKISNKQLTTGCTVDSPIVYNLKEMYILYQFEIR